jgi:hypothetical protein
MGVTSATPVAWSAEIRISQNPSKYRPAQAAEPGSGHASGVVCIVMDGVRGDIGLPPEQEITMKPANAHISAVCKICLMEFILIFLPLENYTTKMFYLAPNLAPGGAPDGMIILVSGQGCPETSNGGTSEGVIVLVSGQGCPETTKQNKGQPLGQSQGCPQLPPAFPLLLRVILLLSLN